jgi:hypothetical protein
MVFGKTLWVAIAAYDPLARIEKLLKVLKLYTEFELKVSVFIYVNYEAQSDVDKLAQLLRPFHGLLELNIVVAGPEYAGWGLTWAHKHDLVHACMNYKYDYYIYQENDMLITWNHFKYWLRWKPRLAAHGLEPGFIRYETFKGQKIPFDNHYRYLLTRRTPNVWSDRGFDVQKTLVVDHEIKFFAQIASPYYAAMILDNTDAVKYVKSDSMDPAKSVKIVDFRNWPLADRSSMGLAFENVPAGHEHRRCIPVIEENGVYKPHPCCLLAHDDTKYSTELAQKQAELITCDTMLQI